MKLLSIGIRNNINEIENMINMQLSLYNKELYIDRKIKKIGDITFLDYEVIDELDLIEENNINKILHHLANSISDIILEFHQEKILRRIVNERCYYLVNNEKEKIVHDGLQLLNNNEYMISSDLTYKENVRTKILETISEYLNSNNEIIIEGFINFRLKFFIDMVEETMEKALENFLVEKEYKEFIKILQYFVDIQESKINLVNVVIKENGKYMLYDEKKQIINNDFIEEIVDEMSENDMNYDDLLISSLITIAPKKIIVHINESQTNQEIIKIIRNVFLEKVELCKGCDFCIIEKEVKDKIIERK